MIPKDAITHCACDCPSEPIDSGGIDIILEKHGNDPSSLLTILGEIQAIHRYLPADALRMVAERTGCSLVDVYGAATFYRSFSLEPKGKHLVSVCMGTACHVRGAGRVVEEFERQLGIGPGETTSDGEFSLETPNCLGACALGPVVVIDGRYFSKVSTTKAGALIEDALAGFEGLDLREDNRIFPLNLNCPSCSHTMMDESHQLDNHPSVLINASVDGDAGWLRLSSLYGSYHSVSEKDIPPDIITRLSCPHCNKDLVSSWQCPMCGAEMSHMSVHGGGTVLICSRKGCRHHMLELS